MIWKKKKKFYEEKLAVFGILVHLYKSVYTSDY